MLQSTRNSCSTRSWCEDGITPFQITLRPGHPLSNTERFWLQYSTRPKPRRSHSISRNAKFPHVPKHVLASNETTYAKCQKLIRKARKTIWRNRHKIAALAFATAAVCGTAMLAPETIANTKAYSNLPPPALLTNYTRHGGRAVPHWLYRDSSYSVLGLAEPLLPSLVPPAMEVDAAFRRLGAWHPDKWQMNGLTKLEAENIWSVIREAYHRFELYYHGPRYPRDRFWEGGGLTHPVDARWTEGGNKIDIGVFDSLPALTQCRWTVAVERALTAPFTTPEAHEERRLVDDQTGLGACSLRQHVTAFQSALRKAWDTPAFVPRYWFCPRWSASHNTFVKLLAVIKYPAHSAPRKWSERAKEKYRKYLLDKDMEPNSERRRCL